MRVTERSLDDRHGAAVVVEVRHGGAAHRYPGRLEHGPYTPGTTDVRSVFTDALSVPETPLKLKSGALPRFLGFVAADSVEAVGGTTLAPYDSLALLAPLMDSVATPVPRASRRSYRCPQRSRTRPSWC